MITSGLWLRFTTVLVERLVASVLEAGGGRLALGVEGILPECKLYSFSGNLNKLTLHSEAFRFEVPEPWLDI